ncbi:MAG TPA: hypothetical protein VFB03_00440 [Candidatus Saccharimonadales bacterium]|nr:hypothetical protein [Candidatus Saccharimonadales bacterium]
MKKAEVLGTVAAITSAVAIGNMAIKRAYDLSEYFRNRKNNARVAHGNLTYPPLISEVYIPETYEGQQIPEYVIAAALRDRKPSIHS